MDLPPLNFTGGPAAPSGARSDNVFDSSGWTVATGGSRAGEGNPYLMPAGLLAAALLIIAWMRRK